MKNLCAAGVLLLCLFTTTIASAQQDQFQFRQVTPSKPALFSRLPAKTECNLNELRKLCSARLSDAITVQLASDIALTGQVVDKFQQTDSVASINLILSNYDGALLNLSLLTQPDKSQKISGRIIHPQSGDILILTEENNRYFLVKQPRKFFMTE